MPKLSYSKRKPTRRKQTSRKQGNHKQTSLGRKIVMFISLPLLLLILLWFIYSLMQFTSRIFD